MNKVKNFFSIKDLENLSGIKAHTIRMWEKRYNLLSPQRTGTNIRKYSVPNLQKLLNVVLLYNEGFKISKIAELQDQRISELIQEYVATQSINNHSINAIKLSMINFDRTLFQNTCDELLKSRSFSEIFNQIFVPFLNELGLLWQADSLDLAQEHFITNLIKQKVIAATDLLKGYSTENKDKPFVLFLPENEIHDIGLLFVNYELLRKRHNVIFLGATLPIESLTQIQNRFQKIYFVSYLTVAPTKAKISKFLEEFQNKLNITEHVHLWLLGRQTYYIEEPNKPNYVKIFSTIEELINEIE